MSAFYCAHLLQISYACAIRSCMHVTRCSVVRSTLTMSESISTVFACGICHTNEASTFQKLLRHVRLIHSNEPHFCVRCGINECEKTYKIFSSYLTHLWRHHAESSNEPHSLKNDDEAEHIIGQNVEETYLESEELDDGLNEQATFKKAFALQILKIRELHKLPKKSINLLNTETYDLLEM